MTLEQSQCVTLLDYAERWRSSRRIGWSVETRRRVPGNLNNHIYPTFGLRPLQDITVTDVMEWLGTKLDNPMVARSSIKLYFDLLKTILNAAVVDRVRADNPCASIRLSAILRGMSRAPKWVPSKDQVINLLKVVPDEYRAMIWLGAAQGMRLAEVFAMEEGSRCTDYFRRELHVVQQLRHSLADHGGYFLAEPKNGSSGTIDLDLAVAEILTAHIRRFPPTKHEVIDTTGSEPVRRPVRLLFTDKHGHPWDDTKWWKAWSPWRQAAGWPSGKRVATFHALRHFFATTLISNGVDPTEVQHALRHASLRHTLDTYVHWLPRAAKTQSLVGALLKTTASG
ncbi:tyrosine-type recombinase/integrase [Longispora sp. K20-0274]|uniref:tyrosine-type recombinase/integrase n=1 Tax=Longispora sp. K20-0274 TaxID=3088255 RepID=UPI00399A4647